ncbi:LysR family transcriptional regulator [Bacillus sp. ISL-75]|uniref:LysR family transcriptional regulator n=1 Tax=unclassified Bacillus (in: firmicutes) TaxID=185979 RepID=UPI001BE81B1C|nr:MULTISPECIES: LysR family transcriptional regulator [unclassified Bacillus (in: firmicutes)]MBT2730716.1 LysR family transcriptional regulator [Bacillus sp. ISL-75]MBT2739940.1 LysR family transcriptional regulator [Bacillus sp. ISL-77]
MDDEQLLTFITVFELNNYTRTADYLNLTQPAVTARIQKLENELDCKLFYRDGKKILLTKEGTALLPYARKILNNVKEVRQVIKGIKTPTITIGLSPAISVSIVLEVLSLLRKTSEFSFELVEAADSVEVSKMIEDGSIDIGLVRDVIPFTNLESEYIFHEKLVFIVGKDHPLGGKAEIFKDDLIDHTMICYRRETALWRKIDERLIGVRNLKRIEVGGFEMVISMIKNNWGFSVVPELILANHTNTHNKDLCTVPFAEFKDLTYNVTGIYKKDSPKLERLLLFLHTFETTLKNLKSI